MAKTNSIQTVQKNKKKQTSQTARKPDSNRQADGKTQKQFGRQTSASSNRYPLTKRQRRQTDKKLSDGMTDRQLTEANPDESNYNN